ncbi:MAG: type II secretion system F family protein [Planctomycetales bacterium]|nr:type II secretion system F family protein [Planctomycetales bacterium]
MTASENEIATFVDLLQEETIAQFLPLPEGLRALADELSSSRAKHSLHWLASEISQGRDLKEALADSQNRLPLDLRILLSAGCESGRLVEVMERYAQVIRRRRALKRDLWLLLTYPLLLFGIMFVVAMLNWIVLRPMFLTLTEDFKMAVPPWTSAINWLLGPALATIMLILASFAMLLAATWPVGGKRLTHTLRRGLPLIGPQFRYYAVREFAELLGMFTRYGLPLSQSLQWTACAVGDTSCATISHRLAGLTEQGMQLGTALEADAGGMLVPLAPLVRLGEQHGNLAEALDAAAEMYAGRAEVQANLLRVVVPPLLVLAIAIGVGLMFFATFSPLTELINTLM